MLAKSSISVASNHTRSPAAVSASAMCCGRSPSFQAWLRKMSYSADTRSGSNAKRELRKAYTRMFIRAVEIVRVAELQIRRGLKPCSTQHRIQQLRNRSSVISLAANCADTQSDLQRLQGKWMATAATRDG